MVNTTQTIFGNIFNNCLMNASGCKCTNLEDLQKLNDSKSGGIVSKTCSLEKRDGNPHPRYYETINKLSSGCNSIQTINSMGLPNNGYKYYKDLIGNFDKPYIISVAGNYLLEDFIILEEINSKFAELSENMKNNKKYQMVEINVSCPNIEGKEQLAYNFNDLNQFLFRLDIVAPKLKNLVIGLKLPPYFDPAHFSQLGTVISKHLHVIKFITAINSVGNTLAIDFDNNAPVIKPKKGLGGLGGSFIKPVALANIWQLHLLFNSSDGICKKQGKSDMILIGCGGIVNGRDAYEHILCGAHLCQIGSQFMYEGPICFERINEELKKSMKMKDITHIDNLRGKLNY